MNKILSKTPKMPYNQFYAHSLIMYDDTRTVLIKASLEQSYTTKTVVVPGQALDVIRYLGSGVELDFKETQLYIKKDKNTCKTNYLAKPEIKFPDLNATGKITVKKEDLQLASEFTGVKSRAPLCGINISDTGIVATNSYQMFLKGKQNEKTNVTISVEFVSLLLKAFKDLEELTIKFDSAKAWVEAEDITVMGSLVLGEFPKTNAFNNMEAEKHVVIDLDIPKVKEASALLKLNTDITVFDFELEDKTLFAKTLDAKIEVGTCDEKMQKLPTFSREVLEKVSLLDDAKIYINKDPLKPLRVLQEDRCIICVPIRKLEEN